MYNRDNLRNQAEIYKEKYYNGEISVDDAREMIMPYINILCLERKKLSKAYGRYLPTITFEKFMRNP